MEPDLAMKESKTYTMYSLATEMVLQHKPNALIESALVVQGCTSSKSSEITHAVYSNRRLLRELLDANATQSRIKAVLVDKGFPVEGAEAIAVQLAEVRHDMNMPEWLLLAGLDRKLPTPAYLGLAILLLLTGGLGFAASFAIDNNLLNQSLIKVALVGMFGSGLLMLASFITRHRNTRR